MSKPIIILDNGHGMETPGKRSPVWSDGKQLFEYEFNRDIVRRIEGALNERGIANVVLVPEWNDIPLTDRVKRANEIAKGNKGGAILISVHANAGGGTGWEVYTSPGQTKADPLATILYNEAEKEFAPDCWKMRADHSDGDPDKESNFYILTKTSCPAMLSENFFMDTEKDCRFIMSAEGRQRVANVHVRAIEKMIEG
jgi:N-acetylmuramoyl-L-alanine amidase